MKTYLMTAIVTYEYQAENDENAVEKVNTGDWFYTAVLIDIDETHIHTFIEETGNIKEIWKD